jgi:hypothetical protein
MGAPIPAAELLLFALLGAIFSCKCCLFLSVKRNVRLNTHIYLHVRQPSRYTSQTRPRALIYSSLLAFSLSITIQLACPALRPTFPISRPRPSHTPLHCPASVAINCSCPISGHVTSAYPAIRGFVTFPKSGTRRALSLTQFPAYPDASSLPSESRSPSLQHCGRSTRSRRQQQAQLTIDYQSSISQTTISSHNKPSSYNIVHTH